MTESLDVYWLKGANAYIPLSPTFPADMKPAHIGWYRTEFYDVCFLVDMYFWWDGKRWMTGPDGWSLVDQNLTWRGLVKEQEQ